MNTSSTCPSSFALDDRDVHGAAGDDSIGRHLATCVRCAARIAARGALDERFRTQLRDPLWRRIQAARPRRSSRWRVGILAPALAAAAAVILFRVRDMSQTPRHPETTSSYRAAKGVPSIRVDGRRHGRVFAFDGSTAARPGDEIQLTVAAARPDQRFVLVGSVDGTGRFSPFYPADRDGHSVPLPAAGQPLVPPIVLDAAPGPERIVVVRSTAPLAVGVVARLAQAAAAGQEQFAVPGTAADVEWLTLQKAVAEGKEVPAP